MTTLHNIGGYNYTVSGHRAYEFDRSFTIPSNVRAGTYYIGAIIDLDDEIDEDRECNNTLLFPGRWRVN